MPTGDVLYQPGSYADYAALAGHHYRASRPAMLAGPDAIRRAIDARTGQTIGVLVVALPTLNASWRPIAWPGWFDTGDKRTDARRLSRDLRTIARVIVAPSHRGLGIASELVRRYLADPLTPASEALAAMGHACPFFEAAGMTAYRLPPTPRDARLLDALAHLGLTPASLLHPIAHTTEGPLLTRELRLWANRSRATRHLIDDPRALAHHAAQALLARPVAYAHVAPNFAAAALHTSTREPRHATLRHAA